MRTLTAILSILILLPLPSWAAKKECMRVVGTHAVQARMMPVHIHLRDNFGVAYDGSATSPEYMQLALGRIFTDAEAHAIITALAASSGSYGDFPIFDARLPQYIGWEYATRLRNFASQSGVMMIQKLPYPEKMNQIISPTQTFIRWNTTGQAVHSEPHIDQSALTLIKREYFPATATGPHLFINGIEYETDAENALILSGGLRPPQYRTNGVTGWYQSPAVPHSAGPVSNGWDLVIFVAVQPSGN